MVWLGFSIESSPANVVPLLSTVALVRVVSGVSDRSSRSPSSSSPVPSDAGASGVAPLTFGLGECRAIVLAFWLGVG
jgi:hypothetical protein